jgi:hypothetical protein
MPDAVTPTESPLERVDQAPEGVLESRSAGEKLPPHFVMYFLPIANFPVMAGA